MNKPSNALKGNPLPPGLISNLQQVLSTKKEDQPQPQPQPQPSSSSPSSHENSNNVNDSAEPSTSNSTAGVGLVVEEEDCSEKPILLVTNGDGIDSPGLSYLVQALVHLGLYNVHVCAPQSDKSMSGHSMTFRETVAVTSAEINGATAFEVSGTPADCVSLALSGALFSWSKPLLVISGINHGSSCGHQMLYSGVVAGAREALIVGVPSLSISLNWKKDESQESDFKDAVDICLPLINAAVRDIEKGVFPKDCSFSIEVPTSPSANKGFKLTKQSIWRSSPCWQAVSANRQHFMSNQQSLGLQLAQLSRDASAAGAARRLNTQKKSLVEIESVGAAGKPDNDRVKKYFRLEFTHKEHQQDEDEELDIKALEDGYVAVTPLSLSSISQSDIQSVASEWISSVSLHNP